MTPSESPRPVSETVSVEAAAARLGLSRSLAYQAAREEGKLVEGVPVLRCGRKLMVPARALDRVLLADTSRVPEVTTRAEAAEGNRQPS